MCRPANYGSFFSRSRSGHIISPFLTNFQILPEEQPLKVFYQKSWSKQFLNIHRKTLLLEALVNKVAGLKDRMTSSVNHVGPCVQ